MVRFLNNVSWAFHVNGSTLSGALDVIVIQHQDGSLHSSPFHVTFGKFKVLKSRAKNVNISVNDVMTTVQMKLNDSGKAFFEEKVTDFFEVIDENLEETKSRSRRSS